MIYRITLRLVVLVALSALALRAQDSKESSSYPRTAVVAGSTTDFAMVRHVTFRGSNYEIGRQMATFARANGIGVTPATDPLINRLRREYIKTVYPAYFDRMRGLAAGFGYDVEDDRWDFSLLWQPMTTGMGCSIVYCPISSSANEHGLMCRNYDFTTGTINGRYPDSGFLPANSRPVMFEIHPDSGYASLAMCDFELLGGVLDGINSEGLAVAIAADDETTFKYGRQTGNEVGLHELLCMRYLLDNCANVSQAKEAMLTLKHYYCFIPCHYLIADKQGNSLVFEFSSQRNQSHISEGKGPQVLTNHPVFAYASIEELPEGWSYDRYRILQKAVSNGAKYSAGDLITMLSSVQAMDPPPENSQYAPHRTLWNALYDLEEQTLQITFYLGESPGSDKEAALRYSERITVRLVD
ncbi:MAG: C45 family peptidase [candidate division Zixibacteria bacterium]|nr:C45 family peptidase [candidate division Zixibacteria bacterium]